MKPICRLMINGANSGSFNMGLDEAILNEVIAGHSQPTLRFYHWNPTTLSIGRFQNLSEEADLEACQRQQVDCIRRITGGGAVLHEHEVTYSFIAPLDFPHMPVDILESYRYIGQGIVLGLRSLGINSQFVPLNDIVVNGKKISGNAQTRRKGVVLQHGTILLDVDVDKMFSLLRVDKEKLKDKMIQDVKERVIGLNQLLTNPMTFDSFVPILIEGFREALQCEFIEGQATEQELLLIKTPYN